jgi:hypothetical protein
MQIGWFWGSLVFIFFRSPQILSKIQSTINSYIGIRLYFVTHVPESGYVSSGSIGPPILEFRIRTVSLPNFRALDRMPRRSPQAWVKSVSIKFQPGQGDFLERRLPSGSIPSMTIRIVLRKTGLFIQTSIAWCYSEDLWNVQALFNSGSHCHFSLLSMVMASLVTLISGTKIIPP